MSAPPTKPKAPKVKHRVWVNFTVFVQREGDQSPWYKHSKGPRLQIDAVSHDQAFFLGEKQMAAMLAAKFHLEPAP